MKDPAIIVHVVLVLVLVMIVLGIKSCSDSQQCANEYKNHQLATCLSFIQLLKQDASKVSINTTGGQLYDFKIVLSSPDVPHEFTYMFSRTKNPFTMDVDGLPNHISELHSLVVRAAPKTINNAIRYVKQNEEFIRQFPADNSPDYY